ncbi:transposase [Enterococcus avium]|uniref:transposase n=1 Tax=Enterococcus avium TaxID=33945 RepID=UPI001D0EB75F|nr:transposase [Enterococcus avium]
MTTITGIGDITAAVLMAEAGDIKRFERPNQLLAFFAGLDASVHQSGDFTGTKNRLSKRGSPYLRRAIWQAAFVAAFKDPALSLYYQKLRKRGKSHGTAIGAVARKLVNIILPFGHKTNLTKFIFPKISPKNKFFIRFLEVYLVCFLKIKEIPFSLD